MVAYPNPSPIIVNKPFYLPRDFLYPIHGVIVLSAFHHQPMCRRISLPSYRMTIKASPSTHTSRKPSSSTKETIFKHARTSAMVGSRMFSHSFDELVQKSGMVEGSLTLSVDHFGIVACIF
ncbi:uncharacterized protein LOC108478646 isoform X3 [Gossypium arboreum]|uniref:Uncharacterized protein isoform X2 n=1 Tax=Gossypium hirsutum TaxID=3635 RepID=A0ABM3BX78_GOSHI|nr:uncharacterized protein LOC107962316 isoform X2 [Gossypium hirsutum]XP_052885912.1 uncharacterized protein LOC108478646 isoform X3 [Gossypium arboreum]